MEKVGKFLKKQKAKKISVIITSYNNSHNIKQCLDSLINQNYNKNLINLEIIIVDNGSTDNSVEILNKYKNKIKIILKDSRIASLSPAIARNTGVQNSRGDILIFSDADCIPSPNWISDMVASFKNSKIHCIIGSREPDIGHGMGTFIRRYDFILYSNKFSISKFVLINIKTLQKNTPFILLSGNNFAIKKKVWNRLGGMKTIFKRPAGEDIMLEIELIKNGYNILFNPKSKIIHIHPISLLEVFKKVIPRSEAIYLLSKLSNNFVNWRHFAKRGHILNFKSFFLNILFTILILLFLNLLKMPLLIILSVLFAVILLAIINKLLKINKKLELILNLKGKKYKEIYKISLLRLFYFNQVHFLLKGIALINFLWCTITKKYDFS